MINEKLLSRTYESIRQKPKNLAEEDKALFQHELKKEIGNVKQLLLDNIYFTGWGTVTAKAGTHFPESFSEPTTILYQSATRFYFNLFKSVIRSRFKVIKPPVIFVVESSCSGYFHWVTEVLPRLMAGGEFLTEYSLVLPECYRQYSFIGQSLQMLGYHVTYLQEINIYLLKEVIFITHFATAGNYNDLFLQKLKRRLGKNIPVARPHRFIYISRRKSRRKIANETEISSILFKLNFEFVYCEDLSMQEQALLFSQTKVLVANHGAGLTNMIFMPGDTSILELRYKNDAQNNCYFTMASALNINYFYQQCDPVNFGEDPHLADIVVDKDALQRLLLLIFHQISK